jgi:hypothetical protein
MRIHEIIFPNNEPADMNRADARLDTPPYPIDHGLSKLASAFTKDGVVKRFWYLNGSEDQPSEPAPPTAAGTELMPSGTPGAITTSWQAEAVENEPDPGHHRLDPFRQ